MEAPLSSEQFATLLSIADAFIPALGEDEIRSVEPWIEQRVHNVNWTDADAYFKESCTNSPEFVAGLKQTLRALPDEAVAGLAKLLGLLYRGGMAAFLFTWTLTGFTSLSRQDRVKTLQNWRDSRIPLIRSVFQNMKKLILISYLKADKLALAAMEYPSHAAIPDPGKPATTSTVDERFYQFTFEDFSSTPAPGLIELEADVVIVGSGSGGGVVAARLTTEFPNKRIVIVEKGEFVPPDQLPVPMDAYKRLYDGTFGAFLTTDNKGAIMAGSSWGGSGVVNYAGALELPIRSRQEWASKYGVAFATTPEFQECFDRVSARMGVSTSAIKHSETNRIILSGAEALKVPYFDIPQNTAGHEHSCGLCVYGCRTQEKQSGTTTWLVDAHKNGAICINRCSVSQVIIKNRKVKGVKATWGDDSREMVIKAPIVVMCAGAIRTPCILKRSGLDDPLIGKNLKVHPVAYTVGYFDDKNVKSWEGSVMTAMALSEGQEGRDPDYNAKIINMPLYPGLTGFNTAWKDPVQWKADSLRLKQSVWTASIARDRDSRGFVYPDPQTGEPKISYQLSKYDQQSIIEGLITACRIQAAAGCDEILPIINNGNLAMEPYRADNKSAWPGRRGVDDPQFQAFIEKLKRVGSKHLDAWSSAHPQGTCRMGSDVETCAVDLDGKVWGNVGLYVADASLMPTATGVNPMLTVMALADWVAGRLVDKMKNEEQWAQPLGDSAV